MASTTILPEAKPPAPIERTEHPHVVKSADTLGGEPRVEDSRIPVRMIFAVWEAGWPMPEIMDSFPDLTPAQIHDALSYAYDHPEEIAHFVEENKIRTVMRKNDLIYVNSTLIPRKRLRPEDIPPGATVYTWETLPKELEE
jgi:uncharacterized protein (DUF433 family)